jgi:hypothetical protein
MLYTLNVQHKNVNLQNDTSDCRIWGTGSKDQRGGN